jgi:hypothetical protein
VKTLKHEEERGIIFFITFCSGNNLLFFLVGRVKIEGIIKFIYSPTNAQVIVLL